MLKIHFSTNQRVQGRILKEENARRRCGLTIPILVQQDHSGLIIIRRDEQDHGLGTPLKYCKEGTGIFYLALFLRYKLQTLQAAIIVIVLFSST